MWNFSFVIPCTLVMLVLLCYYFSRQRLSIRLNRTFLWLLAAQVLTMFFDVVSSLADGAYQSVSVPMLYFLNTAFFVCFLLRIYAFFRICVDALHARTALPPALMRLSILPCALAVLISASSFATGAFFSIEVDGYHSGPAYGMLYGCFFFYLGLSAALLATQAGRVRKSEVDGIAAYNFLLLTGCVVRYLLPRVLVMDTFCTIAILVIYLSLLNPDLYLTACGPAFNMRGLRAVLAEPAREGGYHVLGFALRNYNNERGMIGGEQMDQAITAINEWLRQSFSRVQRFYLRGGRFVLVGPALVDWGYIQRVLVDRFERPWKTDASELLFDVGLAFAGEEAASADAERLVNSLVIALDNARDPAGAGGEAEAGVASIQQVDAQVSVLRALEHALDNNEVEVFLQPLVECSTRRMAAAEALARIRDEQGNIISPGLFVPLAEKCGLIGRLGEQVLEKACAFIRDNDLDALGLRWINVNLSPLQCLQQDVSVRLAQILERYGVAPERIHLEITEQSMIDYGLLKRQVLTLKRNGFVFVLDDYGTGYSNLMRVRRYPFVSVKLDMELVWDYCNELDELLPTLVAAFGHMGMSVTAEGIETAAMADALTAIGCDYLQGFYFSKPLPMDEFVHRYRGVTV